MGAEKTKELLLSAVIKLLNETENPADITARRIAAEAGVNLAMINYYFKSKDELLSVAVGKMIEVSAQDFLKPPSADKTVREQFRDIMVNMSNLVSKYSRFTKVYVPYILLQDGIQTPLYILPILRTYFGAKKTELECRIIAYEMLSFMQLVFLRSDEFLKYTGADIMNEKTRNELLDMQLNIFLGKEDCD